MEDKKAYSKPRLSYFIVVIVVAIFLTYWSGEDSNQNELDSLYAPYNFTQDYPEVTAVVSLDDLDEYVVISYDKYDNDDWNGLVDGQSEGTKAGGTFGNYDEQLPLVDNSNNIITYKEFDVNDKINGQSRDAERFVVGSDDSVYYTDDHYETYVYIVE